jgi:elongation factor Ts
VTEISAGAVKALRDQTGAGMMDCKKALTDAAGDMAKAGELLRERGLAKAVKREGRATSEGTIALALAGASGALVELACETDFVAKTDDFQGLAKGLAEAVAADASLASVEALSDAKVGGEIAREKIAAAIGKLGENIVLRRVARLAVPGEGVVSGYVHAGGKLGVLVGLATAADRGQAAAVARDLAMHVAAADPSPVAVDRKGVPAELVDKERQIFRAQAEQSGKPANVLDRIVEGRLAKFYAEVCLLEQAFVKDPDRSVTKVLEDAGKQLGKPISVAGFVRFKLGEASGQ